MKLNEEIDEDILNDASNLYIDDDENDGLELFLDDNNDNKDIVPIVQPPKQSEPEINLLKSPLEKQKKDIETPVIKDKINPSAKPAAEQPTTPTTTTKDNKPKGNNVTKDNVDNKKGDKIVVSRCKSDSDCDSNSFCITKTGKCTPKLKLNQSGCSSNDQCSNPISVCHSNTCKLGCKVGNDDMCKEAAAVERYGCVEVKDLKLFQEFKGKFNGVCEMVKSKEAPAITRSSKSTMSTSSALLISGSAVIILTLLTICFIYLRGHLKRRHRNTNPDMFLFNKLQRNASQSLAMAQRSNSAERLNMRLSSVGGARFTRWAALSNEAAPESGSGY